MKLCNASRAALLGLQLPLGCRYEFGLGARAYNVHGCGGSGGVGGGQTPNSEQQSETSTSAKNVNPKLYHPQGPKA